MFITARLVLFGTLSPLFVFACISAGSPAPLPGGSSGGVASATPGGSASLGGQPAVSTGGARIVVGPTGGAMAIGAGGAWATGQGGTISIGVGGQLTIPTGGMAATGGAAAVTPTPTNGLGVYVNSIQGSTGKIVFDIRVDNKTTQSVDVSAITLRYWYQDEGLGNSLVFNSDYVKIGYSVAATASGTAAAAPTPVAGADSYIQLSFTGTLAAQGDAQTNDQLTIHVTAHTSSWAGSVNLLNDYSYMSTAGYDDKITLYAGGSLIWGTEPGSAVVNPGTGGSGSAGGSPGAGGSDLGIGGSSSTGGNLAVGGDTSTGGDANTGGDINTGGDANTGGDISTGGDANTGGDLSIGGVGPDAG